MKGQDVKPWSQVDDDFDEQDARDAVALADGRRASSSSQGRWSADEASAQVLSGWWIHVTPSWALAPLVAAAAWLGGMVTRYVVSGKALSPWSIAGAFGCVLVAGAVLIVAARTRRAMLASIRAAANRPDALSLEKLTRLPIGAELQPLYQSIEQHIADVERRAAEIVDEHRQLGLELNLAETQKQQVLAIIDAMSEPVLVTDPFDQLALVNPATEELLGVSRKDVIRQPVAEVLRDEKLVRALRQAREADSRAASRFFEHAIGDGIYSIRLSPLSAEDADSSNSEPSRQHGVVAVFRNITKEREAAKNKSAFVAHAAHELRTPLSSIKAYVEMLVDGEAEDEKTRSEYYDIIQTSADRLSRMIDNILNISRIEAGTVRINKTPVAMALIVKEAIDVVRPQAEGKGITLTEELTPVAYQVNADRDMIYQAVLNLLSNAVKYTPEGGKVHVRMTPQEDSSTIRVDVIDNGVGIPKEDLPRMFEKFFRVEANTKMAKGTGLGLNLVKHIVETIHDGKVTLASEVGRGSTFGMILPLMG